MNSSFTLKQSLFLIVGSLYLITGGFYKVRTLLYEIQPTTTAPLPYISRIIQTGPQKEALKSVYFAELLDISADRPTLITEFDPKKGETKLRNSAVIRECSIQPIPPDTLYIDYTVREPVAWIDDFENIAIDKEGYPFPLFPFFTPKNLPALFLGLKEIHWNEPLADPALQLGLNLIQLQSPLQIKIIDLSRAFHPNLGKREVILLLEESGSHPYLRLSPKNFLQELSNYLELRKQLDPDDYLIDLRVPQLAFIKKYRNGEVDERNF